MPASASTSAIRARVSGRPALSRNRRGAGEFKPPLCIEHRAHSRFGLQRLPDARGHAVANQLVALAHGARRRNARAPAKTLGALRVAVEQRLARIRQLLVRVFVGVIADAQFERVHIERDGQFVHGAFERVEALRGTGRAHVEGRVHVEPPQLVAELDVRRAIEASRPVDDHVGEVFELRSFSHGFVDDRVQAAVALRGERNVLDRGGPVPEGEHLRAREYHAHGQTQRARRHHRERQMILRAQARAERAAHKRRNHPHAVLRQAEYLHQVLLSIAHTLGFLVDGVAPVGGWHDGAAVHLHRLMKFRGRAVKRIRACMGSRCARYAWPRGAGGGSKPPFSVEGLTACFRTRASSVWCASLRYRTRTSDAA